MGVRALEALRWLEEESHAILSPNGARLPSKSPTALTHTDVEKWVASFYRNKDLPAGFSSIFDPTDRLIIAPAAC